MSKRFIAPVACFIALFVAVFSFVGYDRVAALPDQAAVTPTPLPVEQAQRDTSPPEEMGVSVTDTAPEDTDEEFVAGTGGDLDQYLFREDVPNGKLTFNIPITRYYSNQMEFERNGSGFLTSTSARKLIDEKILPAEAVLTLRVWDVDHDSTYDGNGDGVPDPEVDYVYVNGYRVADSQGKPKKLTSGNNTWSVWSTNIPIRWLKFPQSRGTTGSAPPRALNRIEIDIDIPNTGYWAVKCDWGSLKVETGPRPVVLAHGFQPAGINDGRKAWGKWYDFQTGNGWLTDHHIPASAVRMGGWSTYETNAAILATHIAGVKKMYGVDKIHLVAHSKGGVDSRAYLRGHDDVELLVQLGTPNGGAQLADLVAAGKLVIPEAFLLGQPAATQLTTFYMAIWNLLHGQNRNTTYISYAGNYNDYDEWWKCKGTCYLTGQDDTVIRVAEVHALSYAVVKPEKRSFDEQSTHGGLLKSDEVFTRVLGWLRNPPRQSASSESGSTSLQAAGSGEEQRTEFKGGTISTGQTKSSSVAVDACDGMSLSLMWGSGDLEFVVYSPSGQRIDPAVAAGSGDISYSESSAIGGLNVKTYAFNRPTAGAWTMQVRALHGANNEAYLLFGTLVGSKVALSVETNKPVYGRGEAIVIKAILVNDGAPLTGATVSAVVETPDDTRTTLVLYDDGSHGDTWRGDGVYTNSFRDTTTTTGGIYDIGVSASGTTGANGAFSRSDSTVVTVSPNATRIGSSFSDYGLDTDSDGLYNHLVVRVGVDVKEFGAYVLAGSLVDRAGRVIQRASASASLGTGTVYLVLSFDGDAIYFNRANGPYYLRDVNLAVSTVSGPLPIDSRPAAYSTSAYAYRAFQRPPIVVTGNGTDFGEDTNGDGVFDVLNVDLEIEVVAAGTSEFNAQLVDQRGDTITWATGSEYISGTADIRLEFDGSKLAALDINGPYTVTDLSVAQETAGSAFATFRDVYVTQPYRRTEFGGDPFESYLPLVVESYRR